MPQWLRKITDAGLSRCMYVFCWFRGYRIAPTNGPRELEQHDEFVKRIFYEAGLYESLDTPLANEPQDASCRSFLARYKNDPIGAVTVIQNPRRLPIERFFRIQLPDHVERGQVAELTRFAVERKHRTQRPTVSLGLLNAALYYSRQKNVRWWIWCAPSLFLWGFQAYFKNCLILEQLPLESPQIEMRRGREAYFDPARSVQVVLVDLQSVSMARAAREFYRRFQHRVGATWNRKQRARFSESPFPPATTE